MLGFACYGVVKGCKCVHVSLCFPDELDAGAMLIGVISPLEVGISVLLLMGDFDPLTLISI